MPAAKTSSPALICGDDEFAVKQRAKQLYQQWCDEIGGMDHEIIEATVSNSGEALTGPRPIARSAANPAFFRLRQGHLAARLQFSRRRTRRVRPSGHRNTERAGRGIEGIRMVATSGC